MKSILRSLRSTTRQGRGGFTLAEVLVSLALIALLAAVVIPSVAGSLLKGDANRVHQDITNIQTGVSQFLADIHRFPGKYSDLTKAITTSTTTHTDINGNAYPQALVGRWKGPYVTKDTNSAGVVETGFGGVINNKFATFTHTNGISYFTVVVTAIDSINFDRIDLEVDGASATPVIAHTTGLLRYVRGTSVDSTKFFALPIQ